MRSNTGRHRKPSTASALATRTALAAGAATAAVVVSAGAATAGTAPAGTTPTINPFPCTGTPFDTITKSATGSYCGTGGGGGAVLG
jgi:hypothetical protein